MVVLESTPPTFVLSRVGPNPSHRVHLVVTFIFLHAGEGGQEEHSSPITSPVMSTK